MIKGGADKPSGSASTRSHGLIALSTTALALPGLVAADAPPAQTTIAYKFSNYLEDDLPRRESPFGARERYDIDVHQFRLLAPAGRNSDFQLDANHESLSGASPWFNIAGANGDPIVNLSGASGIRDRRSEISLASHYYLDNGAVGASVGYSEEDDYRAVYAGVDGLRHFNNEMTSIAVSFSYSSDDLFPTDARRFNRVESEHKQSASAFVSVSQIVNRTTTLQSAITITHQQGYLSDPYKLRDVRPDDKTQLAWSGALRRFFIDADAALHVNYRFYHDDYGISSHTLDMAWHQNLGRRFQLIPALRYYTQSAADFYSSIDNFLRPLDAYQSSDARLSGFGAISGSLGLVTRVNDWSFNLTAERYVAREKYSAYHVTEPGAGLVQYTRFSVGVDYSF